MKDHHHNYHTDISYQAQFNQRIWQTFTRFKDGSGAIHKTSHWISFCNGLFEANLDEELDDYQNNERWDFMNAWNSTHAGVTYQDYLEYQNHFTRRTTDSMIL